MNRPRSHPGRLRRLRDRLLTWAGTALVLFVLFLVVASVGTYGMVHFTARSEFCNSCHIMEPYYSSWQHSSHNQVACVQCHYEPGALETFEGKFKALSQLAKYVTRTAGTKPWAEVSDQSCMRSGCHSLRLLEGPVQFGRVKFEHRTHLLESRRGRRLRCTSCHSQIVQGQHIAVTDSVCFGCHFMPDATTGKPPANTSNCLLCHGPPKEAIDVAGKPFVHADYVARGVACTECHNPVIEGNGKVGRERCHACHGEVGHIERIGETAFLHEKHVAQHKVECFECHDEIRHGLLPLVSSAATRSDGCGACHVEPHDAARSLYAGRGAVGVADSPSRMFVSRVVCESCHTGRTGFAATPHSSQVEGGNGHGHQGISRVAAAGEADCIHCHGTAFAGMLDEWRGAVGGEIDRLRPLVTELGRKTEGSGDAELLRLQREAWQNFELVDLDGSRGVHNPAYALAALRVSAERIDAANVKLDPAAPPAAASGMAPVAKEGCSGCHVAPQQRTVAVHGRPFSHEKHLVAAGLSCGECHSESPRGQPGHGTPKFDRKKCATCHHQESEKRDVANCAACHAEQETMVRGTLAGLAAPKPGPMGKMECNECHGDAPDILRPKPAACVLCHKPGYDKTQREWQEAIGSGLARLETELREAATQGVAEERLAKARSALAAIRTDGSVGVHNFELAKSLLDEAEDELKRH
jgi:nitrate/TMAO reductase-like tetraheme cytochrome c subunit